MLTTTTRFHLVLFSFLLAESVYATTGLYVESTRAEEVHVLDLGIIEEGETVDSRILLHNEGQSPIQVKGAKVSCGCTMVGKSVFGLEPGEEDSIAISFNSSGKPGRINQGVYVKYSENGEDHIAQIKITGFVRMAASYYIKHGIDFKTVRKDMIPTVYEYYPENDDERGRLKSVTKSSSHLRLRLARELIGDTDFIHFSLTLADSVPFGPLSEHLRLEYENGSVVIVPVKGTIDPVKGTIDREQFVFSSSLSFTSVGEQQTIKIRPGPGVTELTVRGVSDSNGKFLA